MEALASGVPSILTEIPSYLNFSDHKDFALFVPVLRPDRIPEGVMTIIENEAIKEGFRRRGIEVAGHYTIERMKHMLLSFVKSVQP